MSALTLKSSKAEIFAAYSAASAEVQAQRHAIKALREELAMAQSRPLLPQGRDLHAAYYVYVAQQRVEARNVTAYKTFPDWCATLAFGERVDAVATTSVASARLVRVRDLPEALL